ncbi:hypothetical protein CPB85DRAFT_18267 [Mucidula mucida]|nr:hypothetical protein CPB85DRAFT_18267 [Mucidula mucida]
MKSIDVRSERAIEYLVEFLDVDGERKNTLHFVHEVYMFVCSPFQNLFMYDAAVQYDEPHKRNERCYTALLSSPLVPTVGREIGLSLEIILKVRDYNCDQNPNTLRIFVVVVVLTTSCPFPASNLSTSMTNLPCPWSTVVIPLPSWSISRRDSQSWRRHI